MPRSTHSPNTAPTGEHPTAMQRHLAELVRADEGCRVTERPSLTEGIALIRRLRDTAPAEIRDDLRVIADFGDHLVAAARSGGSPDGVAETPQLTQALSHEARWTAAHCPG